MKTLKFYFCSILTLLISSCNVDNIENNETQKDPNFRTFENINNNTMGRTANDYCLETNLIAGQNQVVGTVKVDDNV